ncbi:quinone oxidoreductase [Desulfuromonas versatilis]|uniref:Quinone oxidoreductase n=1 Tax=Desulfuromonas versatilis TaxID=2802975 RepID=A0ABN6DX60_9BACT|nr:NADPH:quinone reductase [Desulfuromonas versatilis]BCR04700.1 quinone oxidoreductase [Desulfuromonas versatilis]
MKAIRVHQVGAPEVMRLEEIPDLKPGQSQVVVAMKAIGVNPVDTYIRSGNYPLRGDLPFTPGFDGAGVIEQVGPGVGHLQAGDRVYLSGCLSGSYAEKVLCEESQVYPLPANTSFAQGAALGIPYSTAWYGLFCRAQAQPGDFVLIHGASGGVGSAAVQIARAAGLRVTGTASSDKGKALVLKNGAHQVLDHSQPGYLERIPELTCKHGMDVVLEMLADVNLGKDLTILAPGGRVVVIGCRGTVEINPRETMGRNAAILGLVIFNATAAERRRIHAALGAGLENGSLNPVVGREMPLKDAPEAHHAVMAKGAYGKIVLVP